MNASVDDGRVTLVLSRHELALLAGSINEALEALDDWEIAPRLGATLEEVGRLQAELGKALNSLPAE